MTAVGFRLAPLWADMTEVVAMNFFTHCGYHKLQTDINCMVNHQTEETAYVTQVIRFYTY